MLTGIKNVTLKGGKKERKKERKARRYHGVTVPMKALMANHKGSENLEPRAARALRNRCGECPWAL